MALTDPIQKRADQARAAFERLPRPVRFPFSVVTGMVRGFFRHDGMVYAANMAFLGMLALFPFLIFLASLSGFMGQTEAGSNAIAYLMENLPPNVAETLSAPIGYVVANANSQILTGGVVMALWTASSGVEAARVTVIRAYDGWDHARPIWARRLENIAIVIVTAGLAITAMITLVLAKPLLMAAEEVVQIPDWIEGRIALAKLIAPAFIVVAMWGLYRSFSPRMPEHRRVYFPGALFVALVWYAVASGMSLYLSSLGRYDATYGGLAGVIITQLFFYVISMGFVLGAEINASITRRRKRAEQGADDAEPPAEPREAPPEEQPQAQH